MRQAGIYSKAVPGYNNGPDCIRYYALMDEANEHGIITEVQGRCDELAISMLEQHVRLGSRKRERAWDFICSAIRDCLWPEAATGCDGTDQGCAFAWLASDDAEDVMGIIGLEPDYFWRVMDKLSTPTGAGNE